MRRVALTLAVVLAVSACTDQPFESAVPRATTTAVDNAAIAETPTSAAAPNSTATPPTTAAPTATSAAPASRPLVDNPVDPALPEGFTGADLPEEPGDRLGLLTDWLEENYDERSSGHAFAGFDGSFSLKFNIDEPDGLYAQALCPFYVELAGLYLFDTEHTVAIHGWVRDDSGRYQDAEWETIDC